MRKIFLGLAALALGSAANASITPVLTGSPVASGGGTFAFTYDATLASDQGLKAGSFFTLYDFFGFTGFGAIPANWTASTALLGVTPSQTLPNDDATIPNVTFTYTGPDFNFGPGATEQDLGSFVVFASGSTVTLDDFTSQALLNNGPTAGTPVQTIGANAVGVAGAPGVPEPETWATMLVGLGFIGGAMRRRGGRSVAA